MEIIIVYIISVIICYLANRYTFSEKCKWSNSKPTLTEVVLTFLPLVNIIFGVCIIADILYHVEWHKENWFAKKFYGYKEK